MFEAADNYLNDLILKGELSGCSLCVQNGDDIVFNKVYGFASVEHNSKITTESIYKLMSMTKPIISVGVLLLVARGKLKLTDEICKYIPEFKDFKVCADERFDFTPQNIAAMPALLPTFDMKTLASVPAKRQITVADLLSHSSGLQQGLVGLAEMTHSAIAGVLGPKTLQESLKKFAPECGYLLGFNPGEGTGYSPVAGFDLLGRLIEIVSEKRLQDYVKQEICEPLDMKDTTFFLSEAQKSRLVDVYEVDNNTKELVNTTGTSKDMCGVLGENTCKLPTFEHGCGGLFGTVGDYSNFVRMLACNGRFRGKEFLPSDLITTMTSELSSNHLEPDPGCVWGAGVKIVQNPDACKRGVKAGCYGWSGAFGTHFVVDPTCAKSFVFMTNRSDLEGSGSYVSAELEKLIVKEF